MKLTRINDCMIIYGDRIKWIEWDESNKCKEFHNEPKIGYSLIVDPAINYKWLTTTVIEIIEETKEFIKFKTENSEYILEL